MAATALTAILRDAALRAAPQRLSCLSSGLPFPFISEHGVEGCEELAGDGDEGDHFRLTGGKQASVEGSQAWVVATGNESGNVESPPCGPPSATDLALALPVARLTGEGRDTDQACDLAAGELAKLGHLGQEGARQRIADPREGDQKVFFLAPYRGTANQRADILVDLRQLLLEHSDVTQNALAHADIGGPLLALAFGDHHLDDLPAPAYQLGEKALRFVRQCPQLGFHRLDEVGNDGCVNRVGFGPLAERLGKVAYLRRIHHHQRQTCPRHRRRHDRLEATGGLHSDQLRRERTQPLNQLFQAFAVARDRKGLPAREDVHIQPGLRHIDANIDRVHLHPSLRNRARVAAPATVRVRWNGGGGAALWSGRHSPRTRRSPVRHRAWHYNRLGDS